MNPNIPPAPANLKTTKSLPFFMLSDIGHKKWKIGSGRQQFTRTVVRRALRKRQRQARKVNRFR